MNDTDRGTFDSAFGRVCGAFRLKLKAAERDELATTYFRVLSDYPLDEVLLAGRACIAKCRTFPRAAEWLATLSDGASVAPRDVRTMGGTEVEERTRAVQLRYADDPCLCAECCRAGVDDREVRYVPTLRGDDDDYERALNPRRGVVELAGHWAHGEELAGWYRAREAFYAIAGRWQPRVVRMLQFDREPGQEG